MMNEKNADLLLLAEQVINQSHYSGLSKLKVVDLDSGDESINVEDVLCLFKISELVYGNDEIGFDKFSVVFNALHSCGASCVMLLQCIEGRTELYLGAVNKKNCENVYYLSVIRDILRTSINGNMPGSEIEEIVSAKEIKRIVNDCLDNGFDSQCITSVSCVPNVSDGEEESEYGIETLLGAVREKNFSIIVIADPITNDEVEIVKNGYHELGTHLSAIENVSVTVQTGSNYTVSESSSESINKVLSKGINLTQSHSFSSTYRREKSEREKMAETGKAIAKLGVGGLTLWGTGGNIGAAYLAMNASDQLLKGVEKKALPSGENKLAVVKPNEVALVEEQANGNYGDSPENVSINNGEQKGINISIQEGETKQVGQGVSNTQTESTSIQNTTKDIHISELSDKLKSYLKWLNKCKNYGMFNCCTYIVSGSASVNLFVAGQYQALIQSYGDSQQPVSINTWTKENGIEKVRNSLLHFVHPTLEYQEDSVFTTAMLLSSRELSKQMALPKKSILGVSVANHASFGVEVVRSKSLENGSLVRVGEVNHMGKQTQQPVLLDLQSLAAHTFIAGTNGSGKSNTVFRIIEELMRLNIPFMVIEPAKGEYKNVFGNEPNVNVYGTNPKKTNILKINPLWFNDGVSVHEHIDKLIEIFNASWSMSAAMPAVLKSSIENAYKSSGWNLKTSECLGIKKFPSLKDVLKEFNKKMNDTAFSEEVKGNYVGALSTRMESLCNGIYEEIFFGEDLGDEKLFDSNVLIDLSRVGSSETKSMIMGMLIMRLQEYRMQKEASNHNLQHITILEEAHHLLRRTSTAQTNEGTNMLGKSVEMISNMIAEMRSYGEGFMIVDQSPGLLDTSVMRNTNTKIILRLPESGDREIVGNTIGLNAQQIYELSRLKTGVATIYQKDWLEPVLCNVDLATHKENKYEFTPTPTPCYLIDKSIEEARGDALSVLTPFVPKDVDAEYLRDVAEALSASTENDKEVAKLLNEFLKINKPREKGCIEPYASLVWKMLDADNVWSFIFEAICENDVQRADVLLRQHIRTYIVSDNETQTAIINLLLQKKGADNRVRDFYTKWAWKYLLAKK